MDLITHQGGADNGGGLVILITDVLQRCFRVQGRRDFIFLLAVKLPCVDGIESHSCDGLTFVIQEDLVGVQACVTGRGEIVLYLFVQVLRELNEYRGCFPVDMIFQIIDRQAGDVQNIICVGQSCYSNRKFRGLKLNIKVKNLIFLASGRE